METAAAVVMITFGIAMFLLIIVAPIYIIVKIVQLMLMTIKKAFQQVTNK